MWVPPQGRPRVLSRHWLWALQGAVWGPSERGTVVQGTMESSWLTRTWGHLSCRPRPARLCPRSWSMLVLGTASPRATQGQAPTVPGLVASKHWPQREDWGPPLTDGLHGAPPARRATAGPPAADHPLRSDLLCGGCGGDTQLSPRPLRGPGGPRPAERGAEVASQPWGPARVPLGAWDSAACRERGGHRRLPGEALSGEPCSPSLCPQEEAGVL